MGKTKKLDPERIGELSKHLTAKRKQLKKVRTDSEEFEEVYQKIRKVIKDGLE